MNTKLFISTFILIFLAELGDKTQLAAMARAATGGDAKWTVFMAASSALVLSTLIAVLLGSVLNKYVPPIAIKITAGGMFILFGVLILFNALQPAKVEVVAKPVGPMASFILKVAADFEAAASEDYTRLYNEATDPALKSLLKKLAEEEQGHLTRLRQARIGLSDVQVTGYEQEKVPTVEELTHDVSEHDEPLIRHAIEHEEATARFYQEMSRVTPTPSLKRAFASLAEEEFDHARRLREYRKQG
jgi:rubrerythrin